MPRPALFPAPLPSGVFGRIPPKLGDRIGGGSYPSGAGASCFLENFVPPAPFSVTREMKRKCQSVWYGQSRRRCVGSGKVPYLHLERFPDWQELGGFNPGGVPLVLRDVKHALVHARGA